MRVLTKKESSVFLTTALEHRLGPAFVVAMGTGVRVGELLGLSWSDVDLNEGTIRISRTLTRIRNQEGATKTKLVFQEPKTKRSRRSIPLPSDVLSVLKSHKAQQAQEKLMCGSAYQDGDLVFATEDGRPLEPRNFTRTFHALAKQTGLQGVHLHALRHTYATRLLEVNEHPKVVQELLGHSQISMTLDTYSHVMPDTKRAAADKPEGLVPLLEEPN